MWRGRRKRGGGGCLQVGLDGLPPGPGPPLGRRHLPCVCVCARARARVRACVCVCVRACACVRVRACVRERERACALQTCCVLAVGELALRSGETARPSSPTTLGAKRRTCHAKITHGARHGAQHRAVTHTGAMQCTTKHSAVYTVCVHSVRASHSAHRHAYLRAVARGARFVRCSLCTGCDFVRCASHETGVRQCKKSRVILCTFRSA